MITGSCGPKALIFDMQKEHTCINTLSDPSLMKDILGKL